MPTIEGEIQELQEKLKQTPSSFLFARLADLYLKKKQLAEAIKICAEGVQKHPQYVNGHFVLGKCYFEDGQLDQAEREFNRVLLYDPEHLGALHYQAKIMKAHSWNNAYLIWLRRILEIDPLDTHAQALIEEYEKQTAAEEEKVTPAELEPETTLEEVASPEPSEQEVKEIFGQFEEAEKTDEKVESLTDEEKVISAIQEKVEEFEQEEEQEDEVEEEQEAKMIEEGEEEAEEEKVSEKPVEAEKAELETEETKEETKIEEEEKPKEEPPPPKAQAQVRKEPIVTPTLGEIYAAQGHFDKAIEVYEILLRKDPTNQVYIEKIEYLKKRLEESKRKEED
ncbi:hypothetical protein B5M50_00510 [candidate division KSB1 bacterium 4484_219]|nr:MAG: hypothetical protein B5M50_00510 [candidate division KSB1 bacterium 4484_219]